MSALRLAWNVVLAIGVMTAMHALGHPIDWPSFFAGMFYLAFFARWRRGEAIQ